jgi:hypothetical protein
MIEAPTTKKRKKQESAKSIGHAFAMELGWKVVGAATMSYPEVARSLRGLERAYLVRLKDHPELALEIRRRIAENLLEQALIHGCSLPGCREKLKRTSRLGFENVERKAHFYLLYARGAFARGHKRVARQYTSTIETELDCLLRKRKSPLAKQCLEVARAFMRFIDKPGR